MPRLVSISYSPWSLRARMALQAMGVPYHTHPYTPTLSEPWLRWQLGRWRGPVTVPVLLREDGPPLTDSLEIVRWGCDQVDQPLIPAGQEDAVATWNATADALLEAGRLRTTRRVAADPAALRESLPPPLQPLGPLGLAVGRHACRALLEKYGTPADDDAACLARMEAALQRIDAALSGPWLLDDQLTYADITVAVGMSFVRPHARHRLGDRGRPLWEEPALADRYAHLLEWRDGVMEVVRARAQSHRQ